MDKEEYKIKLNQINELADAGDFRGAAGITDTIDWKHVKSIRTLCMVSEIYEANRRYDDSIRILKFAYKRSSISKTVLYRLTEVSLKTGDMDEAEGYYNKYEELSPNDSSNYLLKYKIMRAEGAPIDDQIELLKNYKDHEYTERWAYELARLYKKNGQNDKCISECDDMILWFSEGRYVTKAMELKMSMTNLTPEQQKKYDAAKRQVAPIITKPPVRETVKQEKIASEKAPDSVVAAASGMSSVSAGGNIAGTGGIEAPLPKAKAIVTPTLNAADAISKMNQAASKTVPAASAQTGEVLTPSVSPDVRKAFSDDHTGHVQTQLADSIRAVFAGIQHPGEEEAPMADLPQMPEEEYTDDDIKTYNVNRTEDFSQFNVKSLEPESVSDGAVKTPDSSADEAAHQMTFEEVAKPDKEVNLDAILAETKNNLAHEVASGDYEKTDELVQTDVLSGSVSSDLPEEADGAEAAKETGSLASAGVTDEAETSEIPKVSETADGTADGKADAADAAVATEEKAAAITASQAVGAAADAAADRFTCEANNLYGKETDESLGLTREFNFHDELKKAMNSGADIQDAAKTVSVRAEQEAAAARESTQTVPFPVDDSKEVREELLADQDEPKAKPDENLSDLSAAADEAAGTEQNKSIIDHIMEKPETLQKVEVEPRELDDKEEKIFSYFAKIPGISQQVTRAIADVHNNAGDKTSRSGNILMIGRQGSGKTSLADALILGICKDLNIKAAKIAHIVADDLNKKDPAEVVSKLSGGFLVIEGSGSMTDETIDKLTRAMEFRTDDLIVILEDEKSDLLGMLSMHPELEKKFTSSVTIPVLTNDELVTFARTYTKELGYKMDEMGVLALYTMIGDNQKDAEPVTIGKVKDMVDKAIARSEKGGRRLSRKFSKNALDQSGRILLHEKDFDF